MTAKIRTSVCCLLLLICITPAKAQLVANFSGTPLSGCSPLVVQFSDQSTGSPTQWRWDLGNGTISFLQNPSVTYFNPGQYSIKLVVRNAAGADSVIKSQYITVNATPTIAFAGTPTTGCFPLPVQFTDQSTAGSGSIATWEWDFGDGVSSSLQNPAHTYTAAGNYNVSLRIRNSNGCIRTLSKPQYIQISNGVTANFSNSTPNSCNPPATINFQNLSTGTGVLSSQWSFGDGGTSILANPSHVYAAAGSYTVTLIITTSNGCTDTITKVNAISIGSVSASFTSPDNVCQGAPINFTNTSAPAPSAATWYFGDGTSTVGVNASKIYSTPGTYTVKMVANFGACIDSTVKLINVQAKPQALFSATATSSCKPPFTVNFTSNTAGAVNYNWNFGDGNTGSGPAPSHTYTAYGSYDVTLIVTNALGCNDTLTQPGYINISPTDVQINGLPRSGCVPFTSAFSVSTTTIDPIVSYQWNFGDGSTGTGPTPTHIYTTAGIYTVSVIVTTASGCADTATVAAGISAGTKPVPNFTATPRDVCAKLPVNFTDQSTGNITQWLWLFGDGGTSTDQNPIYEYQDTGYFDVTLIVWNNGCPDSIKFIDYIHVKPPIAAFSTTFNCGNPRQITFIDQSIGADQWTWNFGDGNTSTIQNPVHTYADTGTYTISLTVFNVSTGCDYTQTRTIRIISERANFFATDTVICKGSTIGFNSVGGSNTNIAAYNWNFGDGTLASGGTVNGASVTHTYANAGIYDVQLIITDVAGCKDTLNKPLYIRVNGPTADFAAAVPGSCLNSAVVFNDATVTDGTHAIQQWIWNYGDGTSDTLTAPPFQHTYAGPGVYGVSLKVTDSKGCADSIAKASLLVISKPLANFGTLDTISCPNKPINFSNLSTGPGLTYVWDFGDGNTSNAANPVHNYLLDGIYTVKLVITDQYGCTDSITRSTYVNIISPIANFTMSDSVSTCPPLIVQFTNTSTINNTVNWDFGDGTSAQVQNPSHFYAFPGTFNVILTVTGPGGCTDTKQKQIVVRGPQGSFSYAPLGGCNPLPITFTGTSVDRISFIWDYNDGTINSTPDSVVSHTYTTPGVYVPKMILVDAGGCQVPITGLDTIRVNGVDARFGLTSNTVCDAGFVNFSDSSASNEAIVGYTWDFGDGITSTSQNPVHYYAVAGQYFPRLIVRTQSGCVDTATNIAPVKIVASPQAAINATPPGCAPLTATFNGALLVADTSAMSWNWNFGNGNTSTLQNPLPQLYSNPTTYNIQLIATNSSGCKDTVTQTIDAYVVPVVNAGVDTMICKGIGITVTATGATNYTWSPAIGLSCTNCANPVATPDSVTKYIVRGTTPQGCSNTDTVEVKVKYPFVMNASVGDTMCRGGSLRLFATGAYSYVWSPAAGLSSTTSSTPLATPVTTTLYRVIGSDDRGCFKDTSYIPIQVYPIPVVSAGADKTINVGQTVDLIPTFSADVTSAVWTPTTGIFRTNYPAITVKPKETTDYTIEVRNPGGCKSRDVVTVFVVCNGSNAFIPNTFSPNGDGNNEVFYPRGSGLFSIKTLRIFNRWGEIVYQKDNFLPNDASAGWDGTYKGVKLTPDVYVYTMEIICDNSTTLVYKGNVALIQ
jgi:gliding motility-associated-like protein